MSKRFTYYSADVTDVFLLDAYPNAKAAYSLRKLSSTYTGSCIRVRRSSDNTEQDIGFVSNELDTTALLSFVGSNSGFITSWYNQKGTGDNLDGRYEKQLYSCIVVVNIWRQRPLYQVPCIMTAFISSMLQTGLPMQQQQQEM